MPCKICLRGDVPSARNCPGKCCGDCCRKRPAGSAKCPVGQHAPEAPPASDLSAPPSPGDGTRGSAKDCSLCGEGRVLTDAGCLSNLCALCCAKIAITMPSALPCKTGGHNIARRIALDAFTAAKAQQTDPRKRGREDDTLDRDRDLSEAPTKPKPDLLKRSGTYASHVLSPAECYERVFRAWRAEKFRSEDGACVSRAFDVLSYQVLSKQADILSQHIVGIGTDAQRHYSYAKGVEEFLEPETDILSIALNSAVNWGEAVSTILRAEALAAQDVHKSATAFLDKATKTSADVASWDEIKNSQVAIVGPSDGLPDPMRLADPRDMMVLGLHVATVKPERLRLFLQALTRSFTQDFSKRNSKALISPAIWEKQYRPPKPTPAPTHSGQQQHVANGGGGGGGGGGRGNKNNKKQRNDRRRDGKHDGDSGGGDTSRQPDASAAADSSAQHQGGRGDGGGGRGNGGGRGGRGRGNVQWVAGRH